MNYVIAYAIIATLTLVSVFTVATMLCKNIKL